MQHAYHLGIDLHKAFSYWTLINNDRDVLFQGKVTTSEEDTLAALGQLPVPANEIQAAIEPVSQWGWYAEVLEQKGVTVKLADPVKTKLIGTNKLKNDKVDSTILAELLRSDFLPTAYLAPRPTRDLREFMRMRLLLVGMRTRMKNRAHAVLWKHGSQSPTTRLFGPHGKEWLRSQRFGPVSDEAIASILRTVEHLDGEIKRMDEEIARRARANAETKLLMSMPSIGPMTALTIQAEVGDFHRFPTAEKLACYSGLIASSHSSGGKLRFGSITRQGSPYLRTIMVEAATRVKPSSGSLYTFYMRMRETKRMQTARVALARKMLVILWYMVRNNEPFRLGDSGGVKR
jgi:transposase